MPLSYVTSPIQKGKIKIVVLLVLNVLSHTEDTQENPLLLQLSKKGYVESNLT